MPLVAVPLALPPHLHELRAGDIDGDGRDELVMVSRVPKGALPDAVTLTVVHFDAAGAEEDRTTLPLGQEALLWDIEGGLWAMDGDGARALGTERGPALPRIGRQRTPLGGLGPTTPAPADIAADIDHDGIPEVFVFGGGQLHAYSADGQDRGAVPAPGSGALESRRKAGATQLIAADRMPPFAVADADGDGRDDVLLPRNDTLQVYFTGTRIGERQATWALPLDLAPRKDPAAPREGERRELEAAWFQDFDNDGMVDLLVHQWVVGSSWFGATAELLFARGTGSGFARPQRVETETAAFEVRPLDFDGDGDTDLVVPLVDIGFGNLGRALVSRKVQVDVGLFTMDDGQLSARPTLLRAFAWPITDPESVQAALQGDVDGDGSIDLVRGEDGEAVVVHTSTARAIATEERARLALDLPRGADPFFVRDLTGDGRAEIVVWGPGQRTGQLLRLD